jgi:hypothetical protein
MEIPSGSVALELGGAAGMRHAVSSARLSPL